MHCRALRLKLHALDSETAVEELKKLARAVTREEINADNGIYGELSDNHRVIANLAYTYMSMFKASLVLQGLAYA